LRKSVADEKTSGRIAMSSSARRNFLNRVSFMEII
jgi:hypothetical protein